MGNLIILILFLSVTGCSHANVQKRCAKVEANEFRKGEESVCDSLWFWE
jgi:hypothetical protein